MPVLDSLRSTRIGSLKYDKQWLESGQANDILSLCNRFERTLSLSTEEERVITTSPKSKTDSNDVGLGGDKARWKNSGKQNAPDEESLDSVTADGPSTSSSTEKDTGSENDGKRGGVLSDFEIAALQYENELQERLKMAVDKRLKTLRGQWEKFQKGSVKESENSASLRSQSVAPSESLVSIEATPTEPVPLSEESAVPHESPVEIASEVDIANQELALGQLSSAAVVPRVEHVDSSVLSHVTETVGRAPSPKSIVELISPATTVEIVVTEVVSETVAKPEPSLPRPPAMPSNASSISAKPEEKQMVPSPPEIKAPLVDIPPVRKSKAPSETTSVPATQDVKVTSAAAVPKLPTASDVSREPAITKKKTQMDPSLAAIPLSGTDTGRFGSEDRLMEYKRIVGEWFRRKEWYDQFQQKMESGFTSKDADRVTKGIRQELHIVITSTINMLTKENLKESVTRLGQLLKGDNVVFRGSNRISTSKHPDAKRYCCELIARTLVKQAGSIVSVQPEMAFPLAAIAVCLSVEFPEIHDFLMAIIGSNCLYLIPYYLPRSKSESDMDYYVKLGYQRTKGELEKQHLFLNRMSGICRLLAAILCTPAISWKQYPHNQHSLVRSTMEHPVDFNYAWRFIVAMIQLAPRTDITATILLEFTEVTSHFLKTVYGKQWEKLLRFISDKYLPEILAVSSSGAGSAAFTRLKTFLDSGSKRFAPPAGYPSSWRRFVQ